eukprot:2900838-Amphidinium_carterae.1
MEKYPCASNNVPSINRDVFDQYGRFLRKGTVDMRFYYFVEGKDVGSMTVRDIWFERRHVEVEGKPEGKNQDVMLTTFTAKREADPYNGAGVVERPTDVNQNETTDSASASAT